MSHNVVINGEVYENIETVELKDTEGNTIYFSSGDGGTIEISTVEIEGGYKLVVKSPKGTESINIMHGQNGSPGATGPQGPQGPAGATGPTGPQGPQGPAGADGKAGGTGPQGPQGPKGDPGPQGPKGDTGATGPQGPKGDPGATGPAGANGKDGATGPQGPAGPQGPEGPQGPKGDNADLSQADIIDALGYLPLGKENIVDDLDSGVVNLPLSAAAGSRLKGMIDNIKTPTKVSELQNDSNFATHQKVIDYINAAKLTKVSELENDKSYATEKVVDNKISAAVPTKVSQLSNDKNFLSSSEVVAKINEAISGLAGGLKFEIVDTIEDLPVWCDDSNTIYLVPSEKTDDNQYYDEYIFIESRGTWEKLGDTRVNLAPYYTELEVDNLIYNVQKSIPTKVSQLYNDAGYITAGDLETGEATWESIKGNILYGIEEFIEWDGNTEGLDTSGSGASISYRVSDRVIRADEFSKSGMTVYYDSGGSLGIASALSYTEENGKWYSIAYGVGCVFDSELAGVPEGIYFSAYNFSELGTPRKLGPFIKEKLKKELLPDYFDAVGDGILMWDGDTTGKATIDGSMIDPEIPAGYMVVVKVSDIVPTLWQLNLGGVLAGVYKPEEGDAEHHSESFAGFTEYSDGTGIYLVCDEEGTSNPSVVVIMNDGDMGNGVTIEKGIYFLKTDESVIGDAAAVSYIESVSFNGVTEFNKRDVLKAEHMSIIEEAASDTLSWDGDTEGRTNALGLLYHVSDVIPPGEYLINGGSITLNFQGTDVEKVYFGNNMIVDVDEFGGGQLGEGSICIIVNTGLGVTPFIFIAKKPNATFNYPMGENVISIVLEKPGVYFPYDKEGVFVSPGSRASSFSINGYRGFTRKAVKQEHMPVVSGTIKVSTFGEPVVAYRWLNENFGKKIVKVRVTDYPNTSLAGEYDWVFDKVTKETGNGSDGYLYYPSNTPASNLSTTYYAFHSMKSSNPTPDGISMNFLRGGLYQNQFFIREGSLAVGTEGVTWSFDKELRNNKINVNNAGAQDTGWKIEFYYIEE